MPDEAEKLIIQVNDKEAVSALVYPADKKNRAALTVLLGHGAGANQTSGFMRLFAKGLAARGLDVMTFNFIYMEQGRSVPDQKPKLETCFRAVIEAALKHKKLKKNRLVIGGKSMGGRIASQVMAEEGREAFADEVAGLVFLGYPLHPPGNPAKLRVEHLADIHKPMLFVQGTRDTLGTPEEIQPYIKSLRPAAKIYAIEGGDHSFRAPKKFGLPQEQVFEHAMDEIDSWARSL
ncbi:MAG TPA: alpha/beta fold hydrolase [Pyrinomonadaceae bacterium]|jgi:predicted alpha/beta-hydrolase family hydrolase|nr:alpha/beta fold hydrolase [Pyrinomonadaceae bacterium]